MPAYRIYSKFVDFENIDTLSFKTGLCYTIKIETYIHQCMKMLYNQKFLDIMILIVAIIIWTVGIIVLLLIKVFVTVLKFEIK